MTMKSRAALLVAGLMMGADAFAAVTITVPEDIKVLAVNDQEVSSGFLRAAASQYKVDAGKNSISMRYVQYFEHRNGEHDIVKSGVLTLNTPELMDGEKYTLKTVNVPTEFEAAKKYAEQPTVALFNSKQQLLVQQTGANTAQKSWLGKGLFGTDVDLTQKKQSVNEQPSAVYPVSDKAVADSQKQKQPQTAASVSTADQQLIHIWKSASKSERQKFMTWLAEQ